jgi:hypothetical protein
LESSPTSIGKAEVDILEPVAKETIQKYIKLTDDSDDNDEIIGHQNFGLTNDDEEEEGEEFEEKVQRRNSDVSADSSPFEVDLQKMNIPSDEYEDGDHLQAYSDDDLDRWSAGTDLEDGCFHLLDSPHQFMGKRWSIKKGDDPSDAWHDEMRKSAKGCSFWIPLRGRQEGVARSKHFGWYGNVEEKGRAGMWPFNAKSERLLPWETPHKQRVAEWKSRTSVGPPVVWRKAGSGKRKVRRRKKTSIFPMDKFRCLIPKD